MLEKEIEGKLGKAVKSAGGLYYKFVSPGNNGVPDRIAILPGGRIHFIETKSATGRLRPGQKVQIARLKSVGCNVHAVRSLEEVQKFRKEVLEL